MRKSIGAAAAASLALAATPLVAGAQSASNQQIPQEYAASGAPLSVSPALVRQVEQALSQQGYAAGAIDGNWDAQTQRAITNFQQAQGLEPTGQLNQRTLRNLGVPVGYGQAFGQGFAQQGYGQQPGLAARQGRGQGFGQPGFGSQPASGPPPGRTGWGPSQQAGLGTGGCACGGMQQQAFGAQPTGAFVQLDDQDVRQIQQALVQRGYLDQATGSWNRATQQAVMQFQRNQNLDAQGRLDEQTLTALDIAIGAQ